VGCGPRGREHALALREAGLEPIAVADPAEGPREALAGDIGVRGFAGLEPALEGAPPSVVVLATPPAAREELVLAAVAAEGVRAIVVEKPFAVTLPAAERMLAACAARDILLVVSHQLRFVPAFAALHDAVDRGALGELELLRAVGRGDLLDQGPHLIDALLQLAGGRRVEWVMSQRGEAAVAGLPAAATAGNHDAPAWMTHYLAFEGGLRAVCETGPLHQRGRDFRDEWRDKRVLAQGSEGMGEARALGGCRLLRAGGSGWENGTPGGAEAYTAATTALHAAVRESLVAGTPHPCDARGALHGMEVLVACAQSAADGDAAVLPPERDRDPFAELRDGPALRTPAGAAAPRAAQPTGGPDVSVILPLPDHRGWAERSVASWLREQTLPAHRFELIVVSDGAEPDVETRVERLLRSQDRLLRRPGVHEIELYDVGARAARAPMLLFTEPHCVAEPDCLEELVGYLARTRYDGACLRSVGIASNESARLEERYFDQGFRECSREGHWCKAILRGFAVRRDAYVAAGGFVGEWGRFSEFAIAIALHRRGRRLGYAAGACVQHVYTSTLRGITSPVVDFAEGECRYRATLGDGALAGYIEPGPVWRRRHDRDPRVARTLLRAALRVLARPGTWRWRGAPMAVAGAGRRRAAGALFGFRLARARVRAGIGLAWVRSRLPGRQAVRVAAYETAYTGIVALAQLRWIDEHRPDPAPLAPARRFAVAELPDDRLAGFHAPERADGRAWRWAAGLAELDLPVPPGACELRLDTGGVRPDGAPPLAVYVNGRRIALAAAEPGAWRGRVPGRALRDGRAEVVFVSVPLHQWRHGSTDRRELGLPLVSVEFRAAGRSTRMPA
jgi:predicted dehydrogenase